MKKLYRKVADYIQSKIDKYVIRRFQQLMPTALITALYKIIATNNLTLTEKIIEVKKGKIRYTLLVIKDKDCQTIFNLGRHYEAIPVISNR